jgi:hypothetical protein
MATLATAGQEIAVRILDHLLGRLDVTSALHEPFSHIYLEEIFPPDFYEDLLRGLPDPKLYTNAADRHYGGAEGKHVRSMFHLTPARIAGLPAAHQEMWRGVASALASPVLKTAVFTKLAKDLAFRYGVPESRAGDLAGYSRPVLYREMEGYEIAPHPDTRKKVVTMHLYLPADRSQLDLGTALYRRKLLALPLGSWHHRFTKVKQFAFQPNSGYAFVVNNTLTKKSWHGREELPPGAGVRNTLLNTFYETPREGFGGL